MEFNDVVNRMASLAKILQAASDTGREVGVSWPAEGAKDLSNDINYLIRYAQKGHIGQMQAEREGIEKEAGK